MSEKLSLNAALILIEAMKIGRMALEQLRLSNLDELPEATRMDLYKNRDAVNDAWKALAPKPEERTEP